MMDLFPVDTNIVACSHSFVEHALVAAGHVFVVPFEVVCDRFAALDPVPFPVRYSDRLTNATEVAFAPTVLFVELMEDLNLFAKKRTN